MAPKDKSKENIEDQKESPDLTIDKASNQKKNPAPPKTSEPKRWEKPEQPTRKSGRETRKPEWFIDEQAQTPAPQRKKANAASKLPQPQAAAVKKSIPNSKNRQGSQSEQKKEALQAPQENISFPASMSTSSNTGATQTAGSTVPTECSKLQDRKSLQSEQEQEDPRSKQDRKLNSSGLSTPAAVFATQTAVSDVLTEHSLIPLETELPEPELIELQERPTVSEPSQEAFMRSNSSSQPQKVLATENASFLEAWEDSSPAAVNDPTEAAHRLSLQQYDGYISSESPSDSDSSPPPTNRRNRRGTLAKRVTFKEPAPIVLGSYPMEKRSENEPRLEQNSAMRQLFIDPFLPSDSLQLIKSNTKNGLPHSTIHNGSELRKAALGCEELDSQSDHYQKLKKLQSAFALAHGFAIKVQNLAQALDDNDDLTTDAAVKSICSASKSFEAFDKAAKEYTLSQPSLLAAFPEELKSIFGKLQIIIYTIGVNSAANDTWKQPAHQMAHVSHQVEDNEDLPQLLRTNFTHFADVITRVVGTIKLNLSLLGSAEEVRHESMIKSVYQSIDKLRAHLNYGFLGIDWALEQLPDSNAEPPCQVYPSVPETSMKSPFTATLEPDLTRDGLLLAQADIQRHLKESTIRLLEDMKKEGLEFNRDGILKLIKAPMN